MDEEYVKWFDESYDYIAILCEDGRVAKYIMHYKIFSDLVNCFNEVRMSKEEFSQYLKELLVVLFGTLSKKVEFDDKLWNTFYYEKDSYNQFIKAYDLPSVLSIKNMGTYWLKKIDQIEDSWNVENKVHFVKMMANYYCWSEVFVTAFVYQYFINNLCNADIAIHRFCLLQYWEYKEIESFLDGIKGKTTFEKIQMLTKQYCEDEFELKYPDRETLFIKLVENRMQISEAFSLVHRVRKGLKLTENMKNRLCEIGYDEKFIGHLNGIRYLKSRKNSIMKLLYVTNLVGGITNE